VKTLQPVDDYDAVRAGRRVGHLTSRDCNPLGVGVKQIRERLDITAVQCGESASHELGPITHPTG
jgi:hypothetical protein